MFFTVAKHTIMFGDMWWTQLIVSWWTEKKEEGLVVLVVCVCVPISPSRAYYCFARIPARPQISNIRLCPSSTISCGFAFETLRPLGYIYSDLLEVVVIAETLT